MTNDRPTHGPHWLNVLLAVLANLCVAASWLFLAMILVGFLGIWRRTFINSEWTFDMGRLPQPWAIAPAIAAVILSQLFFRWSMRRAGRGTPAFSSVSVALVGAFVGTLWAVYNWVPPVTVGVKVGPAMGQAWHWNAVSWIAFYARYWFPIVIALVTALVVLISPRSPWVAFLHSRRRARGLRAQKA